MSSLIIEDEFQRKKALGKNMDLFDLLIRLIKHCAKEFLKAVFSAVGGLAIAVVAILYVMWGFDEQVNPLNIWLRVGGLILILLIIRYLLFKRRSKKQVKSEETSTGE